MLIDGKAYAADLTARVGAEVRALTRRYAIQPGLAVVLVGDDPASQIYVRNKGRQTTATGMRSFECKLPEDTTQEALLELIVRLNTDNGVNGILVQLPLPEQIDAEAVIDAISPDKDVDGFHLINVGRLSIGAWGMVPCTPLGCLMLLEQHLGDLTGARALVLGRSNIVGKPMASLLLSRHCTVTIAHSRTVDLADRSREADILVAAVGRAEMLKGDWIKPGATVIDVGINRVDIGEGKTRLVGDVDFEAAQGIAGAITPVPGGVGPMTIACLLHNTVTALCRQENIERESLS